MRHTNDCKHTTSDDDILMYNELEDELEDETNLECERRKKYSKSKNYIITILFILLCFNFMQIFFIKIELNDLKLKFTELSKNSDRGESNLMVNQLI
jgi:hypothetical protein